MSRALLVLIAAAMWAAPVMAQRQAGQGSGRRPPGATQAQRHRAQLEMEIRSGFARAVRQRVGLTDQQMQQLGPLTQRFEDQRRTLQAEERRTRMALQAAIRDTAPANPSDMERWLEQLLTIQERRIAVARAEQKELSAIMTPRQRAMFVAMQEQFRRRLEQLRPAPGIGMEGDSQPPMGRRPGPPPG